MTILALFLYLAGFVAILSGALDEKLQLDGIEWLMLIGAALAWPIAAIILTAARMWKHWRATPLQGER